MRKLLTKGSWLSTRPVITTTAAIFLLITLFIGSTAQAFTQHHGEFAPLIAADSTAIMSSVTALPTSHLDIIAMGLPKQVYQTPFYVPTPIIYPANSIIRKSEGITPLSDTAESQASSREPSFTGIITSRYGMRKHPVRGKVRHHNGVDLAARLGQPVTAPATGVITFSGVRGGYGKVIEIDHQNGYTTLLAHNSALLVKVGDLVEAGKMIARAGRTGVATGVHIHLEIRRHGLLVNPINYFVPHPH